MKKLLIIFLFYLLNTLAIAPLYAQEAMAPAVSPQPSPVSSDEAEDIQDQERDKDDDKKVNDKVNEVIRKIYDQVIAGKARYKELAAFDEKCMTMDSNGFLTIKYETEVPAPRGETYPYAFKLVVEPLRSEKAPKAILKDGQFEYALPFLNLQFSGYVVKHPIRRQFDFQAVFERAAEDLVDYQQQFLPLRFMIIVEEKSFKTNQPIRFKVVLANASEHNILVKGLGQQTLFFTLNNAAWGTDAGQVEVLSPREKARQERQKQAEMRAYLRAQKKGKALTTIVGKKTKVGEQIILREGEALVVDFVGEGYRRAQDVEIRGIYQMNVKGLRPTAKVTVKIVKDQPPS